MTLPSREEWLNEKVEMFDIEGKYTNFSDKMLELKKQLNDME